MSDEEPIEGGPLDVNPIVAARALLLGVVLLMAGNGLQGSLLGVRTESEGFSLTATGIVMACYFAGFLAGSRYAEYLLTQVGHIRVFAALASSASLFLLGSVASATLCDTSGCQRTRAAGEEVNGGGTGGSRQ